MPLAPFSERFLAWVHDFAPHEPYVDHPEDGLAFGGAPSTVKTARYAAPIVTSAAYSQG
jgi:hypothetical protein